MRGDRFGKKTWGRIFVLSEGDVAIVSRIIEELDSFEHSYMPLDFITVYNPKKCAVVYGHKFELDMDALRLACFEDEIPILLVTGYDEFQDWKGDTHA